MTPKVDTFEQDIAKEIRRKEATLAEIASANARAEDTISVPKKIPAFIIALVVCFILLLIGLGVIGYVYFTNPLLSGNGKQMEVHPSDIPKITTDLPKLSPTLGENIGRFVTKVEKKDGGYILTIKDYSSVFAFMTRNEDTYVGELADLFSPSTLEATTTESKPAEKIVTPVATGVVSTTTKIVAATSTKTIVATTTTKVPTTKPKAGKAVVKKATSTPLTSASTTLVSVTSTTTPLLVVTSALETVPVTHYSDVTIDNQNMRVWTYGKRTVVYAFVGDKTVLIASNKEAIITLKNAILR